MLPDPPERLRIATRSIRIERSAHMGRGCRRDDIRSSVFGLIVSEVLGLRERRFHFVILTFGPTALR